jgi:hypothetical protein
MLILHLKLFTAVTGVYFIRELWTSSGLFGSYAHAFTKFNVHMSVFSFLSLVVLDPQVHGWST